MSRTGLASSSWTDQWCPSCMSTQRYSEVRNSYFMMTITGIQHLKADKTMEPIGNRIPSSRIGPEKKSEAAGCSTGIYHASRQSRCHDPTSSPLMCRAECLGYVRETVTNALRSRQIKNVCGSVSVGSPLRRCCHITTCRPHQVRWRFPAESARASAHISYSPVPPVVTSVVFFAPDWAMHARIIALGWLKSAT